MLSVLISLSILALLVGGFRFCVSLYRDAKIPHDAWSTSPNNPQWNPDHPYWKTNKPTEK